MPTVPAKKRNSAIDFWRVYCTIAVAFMHYHVDYYVDGGFLMNVVGEGANMPFIKGGLTLGMFFIIGGYLMIASYKSKQRKGLTNESPLKQAYQYTAGRIVGMYPVYFLAMFVGLFCIGITNGFSLTDYFNSFTLNVWYWTGLDQVGAAFVPTALGGNHQWNLLNIDPNMVFNPNFPLWYISALIIVSLLLYYLLAENEGRFVAIWAPLFSIIFLGEYAFNGTWGYIREQTVLGLPINLWWVGGGVCIGCLTWYFVDWLKKKTFTKKTKVALTVLNVVSSVYFIWMSFTNYYWTFWKDVNGNSFYNEHAFVPCILVLVVLSFLQEDYLTDILNQPFFSKLGGFSLYWFCCHYPTRPLAGWIGTNLGFTSYWQYTATWLALCTGFALILMLICKKCLEPMLAKFFAPSKHAEAPVPAPAEAK